jgi:CheY-like chemotaxis protein
MRILFAEDDPLVQESVLRMLKSLGHEVTMVTDGCDAIEQLKTGARFDLVITDNKMPIMTGLEVLGRIKMSDRWKNIPVIVHSGDTIEPQVTDLGGVFADKFGSRSLQKALDQLFEVSP